MPIPYREVGAGFTSFITHVEEVGRRLATSGSVAVGEGKQDAPVGTTLALIEQATKAIDAAHKRLHAAQAEEFQLLKARFREDPEAFWRFNKNPTHKWAKEQFIEALNNCNLVPVADPNNPTSQHRIAKAMAIKELQKQSPELYDKMAVDMRVMRIIGIDPQGLFLSKETPAPPDPRMVAIKEKAEASKQQVAIQLQDSKLRANTEQMKIADRERDRQSREKLEAMRAEIAMLKLQTEGVEKGQTAYADAQRKEQEVYIQYAKDMLADAANKEREKRDAEVERTSREVEASQRATQHLIDVASDHTKHQRQLDHDRTKHQEKLAHDREMAKVKAAARPKPKKKS